MKKVLFFTVVFLFFAGTYAQQKSIPYKFEELTAPQFVKAVELAGGVCVIPLGVMEKHGPHLPLGTDVFESRERAFTAAQLEYTVVFPPYYFGQIFEARHQPGTLAYSNELLWKLLEESCSELSRNGLKKIILLNGHGGNTSFLQYFCQSQLAGRKDYIVVLFQAGADAEMDKEINALRKGRLDQHAGERETSEMFFIRPDLVDQAVIKNESGLDQGRLNQLQNGYTGIWWYARFPNHYSSDVAEPNRRLGELLIQRDAKQLASLIRYLKANNTIEQLQEEFNKRADNPLLPVR